jgi:DNA-binding CsgD family transcriptional regulator
MRPSAGVKLGFVPVRLKGLDMPHDDAIDTTVALLYEAVLDVSRWDAALAAFAAAFDAPWATRIRFDFTLEEPIELRSHGWDSDTLKRYAEYYYGIDPGATRVRRAGVGQWLADEMLLNCRARDQQEYTHDFAVPSGFAWVGGGKVEAPSMDMGLWFAVQRRPDDAPFGAEGARVFSLLLPHLQQAMRIEARMQQLSAGQAIAQSSLDTLKAAVCVVDRSRRAHLLNRLAERMLGGAELLAVREGRLACAHPVLQERLAGLVNQACAPRACGGAFQLPRRGTALPLHAMVLPLPERHAAAAPLAREPLALVVVMDPQAPHLAREAYQGLFGLTETETALLFALVNGDNLAQWADGRGVSTNTARTHLAALFAKAGVDSQARLLRLAKTLPAMDDPSR